MVMHARKHPRLNDGYYDRHNYHETRNNTDYDRKSSYDRRREDYSVSGQRQNSPNRYNHKLPYIDRIRPDKDRYEKYNRDGERLPRDEARAGSYENRTNNAYTNSIKQHIDNKHSSDSSDTTDKTSNSQSRRRSKESEMVRKADEKRENTSNSSERDTSTKTQAKDQRLEGQKTAVRVCGDWSEHVSSSGKKYFYNCKTEVSQWVKPKEWKLADQAKLEAQKGGGNTASQGGQATKKNGSIPHTESRLDSEHNKDRPSDRTDKSSTSTNHDQNRQLQRQDSLSLSRQRHGSNNHRETVSHQSTPTRLKLAPDHRHGSSSANKHSSTSDNRHSSTHSTPRSSSMDTSSSPGVAAERTSHKPVINGNDNSGDDMDISPDGSPKPSSGGQNRSRDVRPANTASSQNPPPGSGLPAPDQNIMWGQALQTLQTLQEVLTRRSNSISQPGNPAVTMASPKSAPSQSPKTIPLQNPHQVIRERQPELASSELKDRSSPAVSDVSQNSMVSSVATAELVLPPLNQSINLPSSLINHYDPSLISHVAHWPAEQIELRASMVNAEGVIIGGHHCGQVSTELKRDRSQVRIAEVQSTLIEHRIHFLKQQISELETPDKGSYSGSTT